MLGKTNITTLSESAVVTEIEDYNWIHMQLDIFGNFVKAIYKNGYLVGITADGTIAYTTDGEAWQTHVLEYEDCKLNDLDWDGSRFIFAGSYKNDAVKRGLIVVTSYFDTYEIKDVEGDTGYADEYFLVYPTNGKYIVLTKSKKYFGNLEEKWESEKTGNFLTRSVSKNSSGIIVAENIQFMGSARANYIERIDGSTGDISTYDKVGESNEFNFFECKDELYCMTLNNNINYRLYKITNSNECVVVSNGKNFAFVDGVYFDESRLFINNHEMLIVKKGENIEDKTLGDLIEVAPEFTMNCIEKAFGQLYIFGNQGLIMKSSVETNNEEAITVQTISAKKALFDAKKYTDERYAVLEARIAALESGGSDGNA